MKKYKVKYTMDNNYKVVIIQQEDEFEEPVEVDFCFQGSLSDCEAYIRLTEDEYL